MPNYEPPDSSFDPPDHPEYEEKECPGCSTVKEINVESDYCDDCLDGMQSAAEEAKRDEAKDEGRI